MSTDPSAATLAAAPPPLVARIPTAFFGAVLGLGGLANGWRVAARLWGLPGLVGDGLAVAAFVVWALVAVLIGAKWLRARPAAMGEMLHPIAGGFTALAPIATMIAGLALLPLVAPLAVAMLIVGLIGYAAFAAWFVGRLWTGGRGAEATTPVLYMPTVGGSFVAAMALAALGVRDAAMMAFGAGFLSWIVLEAVMWQRLVHQAPLPVPLRATMGIQMAPPAVGLVAYLAANGGALDVMALMLFGYALLQAAIVLRMLPWLREQSFGAPWWAYSFAIASLPTGAMRLAEQGSETAAALAPSLFLAANLLILGFAALSVKLIVSGRYVPPATPPAPRPPAA